MFILPISGGFRNKISGSLYHHASTQTPIIKKELKDFSNLRTRETQTFKTRTLSVQSYREAGLESGFLMLLFCCDLKSFLTLCFSILHPCHTHTHTQTHTISLSLTHVHSQSLSLYLILSDVLHLFSHFSKALKWKE